MSHDKPTSIQVGDEFAAALLALSAELLRLAEFLEKVAADSEAKQKPKRKGGAA